MFGLSKKALSALLLGQVISLLIAGTGVASTVLANKGVSIPTAQSSINYVLLCGYLLFRLRKFGISAITKPSVSWWRYALLALADVEANYLVVKAYQYTSITSIMLIDCWTIPCVMVLSYWFLKAKFTRKHVFGVLLCLAGLAVLVISDYLQEQNTQSAPQPIANKTAIATDLLESDDENGSSSTIVLGDLLCFAAATLYAVSNIGQEILVKRFDRVEFLSNLGMFGVIFNTIQLAVLERTELAAVAWDAGTVVAVLGFALCLFCMYSLTSVFLQRCDSTLFNLSLLTSDLWAILASVIFFHKSLHPLYFLSLVVIVAGLYLYNTSDSGETNSHDNTADNTDTDTDSVSLQYQNADAEDISLVKSTAVAVDLSERIGVGGPEALDKSSTAHFK